jgi:hypothetical protein
MLRPTEQIAEFFARGPSRQEIMAFHLSDESLAIIRELLSKNSAGALTPEEAQELDELVLLGRILTLPRMNGGDARTTHVPTDHVGVRGACPAPPQGGASEEAPCTHLPPYQ